MEFKGGMMEKVRGVKQCVCGAVMHEHVDDRLDSYWQCPNCGTKIRIFHRRIEPQRGINSRGGA
jgi:DNA-directed RNA polymerase subunit RPC12/RpoP